MGKAATLLEMGKVKEQQRHLQMPLEHQRSWLVGQLIWETKERRVWTRFRISTQALWITQVSQQVLRPQLLRIRQRKQRSLWRSRLLGVDCKLEETQWMQSMARVWTQVWPCLFKAIQWRASNLINKDLKQTQMPSSLITLCQWGRHQMLRLVTAQLLVWIHKMLQDLHRLLRKWRVSLPPQSSPKMVKEQQLAKWLTCRVSTIKTYWLTKHS